MRHAVLLLLSMVAACGTLPLANDDASAPDATIDGSDDVLDVISDPSSADATDAIDDTLDAVADADAGANADAADVADVEAAVEAGASIVTLVAAGNADQLAVDSTTVYWTTAQGAILTCSVNGCGGNPSVFISGQGSLNAMTLDSTNVYFDHYTAVSECPKTGCDAGVDLATGTPLCAGYGLAVDSTKAYWSSSQSSGLYACALAGCGGNPTKLTSVSNPKSIIVAGSTLYWAETFQISSCPITGCVAPSTFASVTANALASDGTNVYWTDGVEISYCPTTGCVGSPKTLASAQSGSYGIVVDGTNVYWTTSSSVMKCTTSCTTPIPLASAQAQPRAIAVDSTSVYWVNSSSGDVRKITPK